ncbi:MAG: cation transporter [Ignavibacteria bacterium]|nr:cation transporter [Ignavibacteria bacterium]
MTHPSQHGLRSTFFGIVTNTVLAAIKGIAGVVGNSYALIADAVESATDIASSLIVWGGLKISGIPPDADHPYGHGKAEPLAAIVISLALVAAAIGIGIQSVREIITPHHAPAPFTLIVLLAVVITKELLFRFVFAVGSRIESTAVMGDAWHHRSDAITSTAAFIGISIALIGGPGYESADDWAALFASVIITANAYRILRPAVNEVMDAAPSSVVEDEVRRTAQRVEGVIALEKCFIRKMGFSYYVDLHVTVDGKISVRAGHDIAREVKTTICRTHPTVADVLVHIEPSDLLREAQ